MNIQALTYFKQTLIKWLDDIATTSRRRREKFAKSREPLSDPVDRASFYTEQSAAILGLERDAVNKRKIISCLRKIEAGDYGICENCGMDIPVKRLKARPIAAFCVACKTKMECSQRRLGA